MLSCGKDKSRFREGVVYVAGSARSKATRLREQQSLLSRERGMNGVEGDCDPRFVYSLLLRKAGAIWLLIP